MARKRRRGSDRAPALICKITADDLQRARDAYEKNVPRDLFYRAATILVSSALAATVELTVGEALSVLLETWNRAYYRHHPIDKEGHYRASRVCLNSIGLS